MELKLSNSDLVILIDRDDFPEVSKFNWYTIKAHQYNVSGKRLCNHYVVAQINGVRVRLHRLIMRVDNPDIHIDHINGNGLDNRKSNLRKCTNQQNCINRPKQINNTSGFKGVFLRKSGKYRAGIRFNQKLIHLGTFVDKIDAAKAYNDAAIKYFGEFAYLNDVENK